jgi:uncharacterized protein
MDEGKDDRQLTLIGLSAHDLNLIRMALQECTDIRRAIIYGSRAKGNAKAYSDIDLAVDGLKDDLEVARIAMILDELPLPFRFDVKRLESIDYAPLREHIDRVGITIYVHS